ncbi:hypothetical protein GDO78_001491 [Eleutherodactylus coqui]|uniref:Uncharacterized protein n=1 Tax=Eleutherodactylus coqui TaxID=57060 RepID=A0A8J6FUA7_ELECQ|nr:hypothetical protein GDO78_001491 [Eleutherodactylus coqui]
MRIYLKANQKLKGTVVYTQPSIGQWHSFFYLHVFSLSMQLVIYLYTKLRLFKCMLKKELVHFKQMLFVLFLLGTWTE